MFKNNNDSINTLNQNTLLWICYVNMSVEELKMMYEQMVKSGCYNFKYVDPKISNSTNE